MANLTAAQVSDMMNGLHYVNIHTEQFQAGEIRGQILPVPDDQLTWTKDTLCVALDPPCAEHTGACCDGTTGNCDDDVPESACPVACFGECVGGSIKYYH